MSLDWELHIDECPTCHQTPEFVSLNMTSNLVPMQEKAGVYEALRDDGSQAGKHLSVLRNGIDHFYANKNEYEALNPANGWGDAELFISFIEQAYIASRAHPNAIIRACY